MNWRTAAGAVSSWRAISRLAREVRPRAVIGTGGYAAGVALAWAGAHGVPTLLHEPDSYPGLTTRTFVRWARAIYLGFPEAAGMLSLGSHTEVLEFGCPIDPPPAVLPSRAAARAKWDLPEDAFTVLVVGGSQGARVINETIADWIDGGLPENVCLVWATGRQHAGVWLDRASHTVKVQPYLSRIADAYAVADMAVARAGAMSIAELCAWGIPTILVPLPSAAQDHQTHNARATAQAGGALYLAQRDFTAVWLDAEVRALRADPLRLAGMSGAMRARARPEAAQAIARSILAILGISPIGIAGSGGSSFPEA